VATIREQHAAAKSTAQAYIANLKAKGADVTDAELDEARRLSDISAGLKAKVDRQESLSVFDGIQVDEPGHRGAKALSGSAWGREVSERLQKHAGTFGAKAILGSELDVPTVIIDPVPLAERPVSLIQLFAQGALEASTGLTGANSFSFHQQTERNNAAGTVPDGALKPTSSYKWTGYEDRVRVIAHLSDTLPKRILDDAPAMTEILSGEMYRGLLAALEEQTLNGDGQKVDEVRDPATGAVTTYGRDDLTGILQTSGIQSVPAVEGDILTTLSNGYYSQAAQGDKPTAWVLNPRDVQRLLLLRENGTTGALMFASGRSALESFIGDAPIVESTRMPAGTALVGDFSKALLVTRQDATLEVDKAGTLFDTNQVKLRVEGRYGFAVTRPSAFTRVTLPA